MKIRVPMLYIEKKWQYQMKVYNFKLKYRAAQIKHQDEKKKERIIINRIQNKKQEWNRI